MSARTLIRQSLTLAFTLTAASAALAEQPVRHGYRDSIVISSSSVAPVAGGAGYRDAFARTRSSPGSVVTARAAGYRDSTVRLAARKGNVQMASAGAGVRAK